MTAYVGDGLGGKTLSWVPDPVRYILMYEPPARRNAATFYHWHYCNGKSDICPGNPDCSINDIKDFGWLLKDPQRFVSPILFVDGHVAKHDFTKTIRKDPVFCCEQTRNWILYKPVGASNVLYRPPKDPTN